MPMRSGSMRPKNSLLASALRSSIWSITKDTSMGRSAGVKGGAGWKIRSRAVLPVWSSSTTTNPWLASASVRKIDWKRMPPLPWEKTTRGNGPADETVAPSIASSESRFVKTRG